MSMNVRQATPADADTVCLFNSLLAEESEGKKLDLTKLRPGVAAVLEDPHKGYYFVAEHAGAIIGQLALTYEWSDWRNGWFWWIQSVYVRPEARRQGVFRALFAHVLDRARRDGNVIGIRLYVETDNQVAHSVYHDLGLAWTSYKVMERFPL
jgi:GNAT superfamily N-acetyltransferase